MADKYDMTIEKGATFTLPIQWKPAGVAADMTGFTARMQIRRRVLSENFIIELTTENNRIVYTTQTEGKFNLSLTADETSELMNGVYDLEIVSPSGIVTRLLEGIVTAKPEVTR